MTDNPQDWQRPPQQQWPPQPPTVAGQPQYPYQQQLPPVFPPGYQGQPNAQGLYPPPQYQPPRPPPRKSHTGRTIAIIAACAIATFIVVGAIASGGKSPSSSAPPAATGATTASSPATQAAAAATVTYVVTGSPADVTYGPAGSSLSGSVPMHKSAAIPGSAPAYYSIDAQLQGGGSVTCEIKVGGKVISQSTASGSYNIATCEITQDPLSGGWQDANSA